MKRVVITGFGIFSSIGNTKKKVYESLKKGKSGIIFSEEMKKFGLNSQIWGNLNHNFHCNIDRKNLRFMTDLSLYAFLCMNDAIEDSMLNSKIYRFNPRVGLIVGSSGGSPKSLLNSMSKFIEINNKSTVDPYIAIKNMTSSISASLGVIFNIYGVNYSINSACVTSTNCIGSSFELISSGNQDIIFSGGSEELSIELVKPFDSMKILSKKFNNTPHLSSRAYDIDRDGFVISGGAGILVLEEFNHAIKRKAKIYAEIIGYNSTCDGFSMTSPSGDGCFRSMKNVLNNIKRPIDYLNSHGTSTVLGDSIELKSIKKAFKFKKLPLISSTKSITGHSLGASGVHEIIYIILMFQYNFIAPSINIYSLDKSAKNMNIVRTCIKKKISLAMSNSSGFGGVNATLVLKNMFF